ncbi:MAG: hypothetical protein RLZZ436_4206 [Planctomycetota bacterium]
MRVMPVSVVESGDLPGLGVESLTAAGAPAPMTMIVPKGTPMQNPNGGNVRDDLPSLELDVFPRVSGARTIPPTPGDAYRELLRSMDQSYVDVREASRVIAEPGSGLSVSNLLDIQRKTFVYSVMVDLATRVTDRLGQGIQTLMRNQ